MIINIKISFLVSFSFKIIQLKIIDDTKIKTKNTFTIEKSIMENALAAPYVAIKISGLRSNIVKKVFL